MHTNWKYEISNKVLIYIFIFILLTGVLIPLLSVDINQMFKCTIRITDRPSFVYLPSVRLYVNNLYSRLLLPLLIFMKLGRDGVLIATYKCCFFFGKIHPDVDPGRVNNVSVSQRGPFLTSLYTHHMIFWIKNKKNTSHLPCWCNQARIVPHFTKSSDKQTKETDCTFTDDTQVYDMWPFWSFSINYVSFPFGKNTDPPMYT